MDVMKAQLHISPAETEALATAVKQAARSVGTREAVRAVVGLRQQMNQALTDVDSGFYVVFDMENYQLFDVNLMAVELVDTPGGLGFMTTPTLLLDRETGDILARIAYDEFVKGWSQQ